MVNFRQPFRPALRPAIRWPDRPLDHACLRPGRRPGPDDLSQALTAFSRAIGYHRRLARLAPEFFDTTTVDRELRRRVELRRWMAIWEPALRKAYGPDSDDKASDPDADLPRLPGPRTQRVVERELAGWQFWMAAGRVAMDRYRTRRPHDLPSFCQLARLLCVALAFKQLALGDNPVDPASDPADHSQFFADLERAYGDHSASSRSGAAHPACEAPHPCPSV